MGIGQSIWGTTAGKVEVHAIAQHGTGNNSNKKVPKSFWKQQYPRQLEVELIIGLRK